MCPDIDNGRFISFFSDKAVYHVRDKFVLNWEKSIDNETWFEVEKTVDADISTYTVLEKSIEIQVKGGSYVSFRVRTNNACGVVGDWSDSIFFIRKG